MNRMTIFLLLAMFIAAGCGGSSLKVEKPTSNRPEWIEKGTGAFGGDGENAYYGVGFAETKTHPTLSSRRTAADLNARAALARSFKTTVMEKVKTYERIVSDGEDSDVETFYQQALIAMTNFTLTGAFIVNRYYDKSEKAQYSLARVSIKDFKNQIQQMETLSDEVESIIIKHAEEAFGEF
ncbi:MAG: LPP20 family lipoprotein [Candidatus Marinimicrobia bacterium]|nr:LPP20 family lipoprotein [Candidatus Neomarinimicrobiota bacterium]